MSKPADMRNCAAKTPMTNVSSSRTARVLPRCAKSSSSRRLTRLLGIGMLLPDTVYGYSYLENLAGC